MGIIFFILAMIVLAAITGLVAIFNVDRPYEVLPVFIFILIFALIPFFILSHTPTAMHVYQGKTTLEITYKDGIAIDSTVVFKNKEK